MMDETKIRDEELNEELLHELLKKGDVEAFREEFLSHHPYDQASFYEKADGETRQLLYQYLSPKEMADIFEAIEVDDDEYEDLFKEMDTRYASDILSYMYTDDAVDVLNELNKDQVASYLTIMDKESAQQIKDLLHYEEYTAGSIMTTEFVAIPKNSTVRSAMNILRNAAPNAETIYYVFVIDEDRKLSGIVTLRDLIVADEDTLIEAIMNDRVVSVQVSEDQEEVARMIKDYDFLALPVVDFQDHLLGIITVDDIIDVLDEEASDDYSKLAAVSDMDTFDRGPLTAAKKRLPWLILLTFLGMLTANLMGMFEATLDQVALLAVFIPLIAGMAGNSGTQALAVAVRGIATGDIEEESKMKLLFREAGTGLITGVICGIVVVGLVYFWKSELLIGMLVGTAVASSIFVATLAGSFIPLLIHRMKIDPAVASGPFITTLNDIISILIYLGLATTFLTNL
ncbi:magnesium transporter [Planococcus sp. CP5-4]|uniref:magnesium transporter n=1 Tax=unclassified Planococcus (in: firmicutes) TaxID=2662419 RepID=UPI001C242BCF|nr:MULTISPECIES: magnesium transporter [unclassified Planococcus (in: firmicutes)]MBU9672258.1 magnesium transporter [Planococcus sp. CP5-4_YE]MBV0907821.1 magnesium transporter [Planococcus sp. CP5-4_UN]MBW6062988.1 magnesium transporter [Planococcus sp. CP5-4]MDN5710513.1 magnesium transporter [Planococcus sp. (in: firmicutes)]